MLELLVDLGVKEFISCDGRFMVQDPNDVTVLSFHRANTDDESWLDHSVSYFRRFSMTCWHRDLLAQMIR